MLVPDHVSAFRHLTTEAVDGGLRLVFLRPDAGAHERQPIFEYEVSRTAIGVSFSDGVQAVAVGERAFVHDERSSKGRRDGAPGRRSVSRMWIALDEAEGRQADAVFSQIVALKDRYLPRTVYCPARPAQLAESLRRTEGLSYYLVSSPAAARGRWKSFRSFGTTAGVYASPEPDEETVHRDLEHWFTSVVIDPESAAVGKGEPIYARDGSESRQLTFPTDLNTKNTFAGFQQGRKGPCQALWYAVHGLSSSRTPLPKRTGRQEQDPEEAFVSPGY